MLNVREPTGAPLMNPNSNGATSRPVLYQNVLQYVNDLQHAAYKLRHIEHERAHGRAAPESQQQWRHEKTCIVLQCVAECT